MSRVLIRYRSGHQQEVTVDSLNVRYSVMSGDMCVTKMEWADMDPYPVFINIEAIESVWELTDADATGATGVTDSDGSARS